MNATLKTDKIQEFVHRFNDLEKLTLLVGSTSCWLVGGCLRDLLLGQTPEDIDLVFAEDPTACARRWSRKVNGHWFWLDKERRQSRVLLPDGMSVDFAPLRAENILEDLELRDFTVNALAYPLNNGPDSKLLDPLNGISDLDNRLLKECSPTAFQDDPLRMLKGVRHSVLLNFSLSEQTVSSIREFSALIQRVAAERSRDELMKILAANQLESGILLLFETGLLECLFRISPGTDKKRSIAHNMGVYAAYLKQLDNRIPDRNTVLILAFLIEECRPDNLPALLDRGLRLSRYQQRLISQLIESPEALPNYNTDSSCRQKALIFESLQPFALEKLIRWNFTRRVLTDRQIANLHEAFQRLEASSRIPDLISGRELIKILGGPLGKQLGILLEGIKAAEITGEISSQEDAVRWLSEQK